MATSRPKANPAARPPAAPRRKARPAAKTRDRLPTDARRRQILQRAIEVFASTPYDDVNMDTFAAELGISKGLVFHYFPTKRALYVAGLLQETEALLRATMPTGTGLAQAAANLQVYFEYVETRREAFLYLMRGAAAGDRAIATIMNDMRLQYMQRVCRHLQSIHVHADLDDPFVRIATRSWVGLVETASVDWLLHGAPPPQDVIAYLLRMLTTTVEAIAAHTSRVDV